MLVLFETAAGFALFKMVDDGKLESNDLWKDFETPEKANKTVKLKAFQKFENTVDALSAVTGIVEGKIPKNLKKFLEAEISEKEIAKETLAILDPKMGGAIQKKLGMKVLSDSSLLELYRGIRTQLSSLITGLSDNDMQAMSLGLSHSLSRYKLKFSPDKVDTMIVQAIALLDDLDKELNTYAMRVKEWYGWHFPEMSKIIVDNLAYAKAVRVMRFREKAVNSDLSDILPEELEKELKDAAEISMGTEISDEDMLNIDGLCDQVIKLSSYRTQLYEYLKNRMHAIAPNLTALVGELVGARLISHAGSLMNLAKQPASTVQILGAEKALFRALKTKHDTPKYGLIYHASLVGQAGPKIKGKIARMVATKAAISIRVDALGEGSDSADLGTEMRGKVEARLRQLEGRAMVFANKDKSVTKQKKFELAKNTGSYNTSSDAVLSSKMDIDEDEKDKKKKKDKKEKKEKKGKKEDDKNKMEEDSDDADEDLSNKAEAKSEKIEKKDKEKKKEKKEKKDKKDKNDKKDKKDKKNKKDKEGKAEKSEKKEKAEEKTEKSEKKKMEKKRKAEELDDETEEPEKKKKEKKEKKKKSKIE